MVIIDTDVILLEFAFHRDPRHETNSRFMEAMRSQGGGITLFTLMEFLGQMSFNLSKKRLRQWRSWLMDAYNLSLVWPHGKGMDTEAFPRSLLHERPLERMSQHGMAYMDCLIIDLAEEVEEAEFFITWNARHFRGETSLKVMTPQEYV